MQKRAGKSLGRLVSDLLAQSLANSKTPPANSAAPFEWITKPMRARIDVNILLYASDESSALHGKAADPLGRCAAGREVFCIAWLTAMSYMRIATHPSIFRKLDFLNMRDPMT